MTPIRGQGHGGSKGAKMADFEVYPVRQYAKKINRLTVNSDTLKQYLNLTGQIFDIRPRDFQSGRCTFGKRILLLRSRRVVP